MDNSCSRGFVLQKNIWGIAVVKYPKDEEKALFVTGKYNAEEKKWEFPILGKDKKGNDMFNFTILGNDFVTCDGTLLSLRITPCGKTNREVRIYEAF